MKWSVATAAAGDCARELRLSQGTVVNSPTPLPPPPPPRTESRLPLGRWILLAGLGFAVYAWTFGPYGIVRQWNKSREATAIQARNDSLRVRNLGLIDSIELYQRDSSVIAAEARRQGLVLPGEISVRFVDTSEVGR